MREVVQLGERGTRWERFKATRLWRVMLFVSGMLFIVRGLLVSAGWRNLGHRDFSWVNLVGGVLGVGLGAAGIYYAVKGRGRDAA